MQALQDGTIIARRHLTDNLVFGRYCPAEVCEDAPEAPSHEVDSTKSACPPSEPLPAQISSNARPVMSPFVIGSVAFCCVFGAAAIGMLLRARLPDHHLSADSRDAIKLATAVVGTLSALALGLLIASSKRSFDEAGLELRTVAARVLLLDRVMAQYGQETAPIRATLRGQLETRLKATIDGSRRTLDDGLDIEPVQDVLRKLTPQNDGQRWLQTRALQLSGLIAEARWLRAETEAGGFPGLFLAFLVFWLALLFGSFGLLAPSNATTVATLFVCAFSVTGALTIIIDMDHPYLGFIRASDAPLRLAMERLGQP